MTVSYAPLAAYGPSGPKPEIDTYTISGFTARRSSYPRPSRSMTPGRKFWTKTSVSFARDRTRSRPSSRWTSTAIDRFPRLHIWNRALSPFTDTPIHLAMSPTPGRSTLMTFAP